MGVDVNEGASPLCFSFRWIQPLIVFAGRFNFYVMGPTRFPGILRISCESPLWGYRCHQTSTEWNEINAYEPHLPQLNKIKHGIVPLATNPPLLQIDEARYAETWGSRQCAGLRRRHCIGAFVGIAVGSEL